MFLLITKCGKKTTKKKTHFTKKTEPRLEKLYENKQRQRMSFCWPLYHKFMTARAVTKRSGAEHTALLTRAPEQASSFFNHHQKSSSAKAYHALSNIISLVIAVSDCPPTSSKSYEYLWPGVLFLDNINFLSASANSSFHLGQMALTSVVTIDMSTMPV